MTGARFAVRTVVSAVALAVFVGLMIWAVGGLSAPAPPGPAVTPVSYFVPSPDGQRTYLCVKVEGSVWCEPFGEVE